MDTNLKKSLPDLQLRASAIRNRVVSAACRTTPLAVAAADTTRLGEDEIVCVVDGTPSPHMVTHSTGTIICRHAKCQQVMIILHTSDFIVKSTR